MSSERDVRLAQAEKLIRRGELTAAGEILRLLHNLFPDDAQVATRLDAVTALEDPRARSPSRPGPVAAAPPRQPTPEEVAEERIARGDVATGIVIYEKILAKFPDHPQALARLAALRPPPVSSLPADPVDLLGVLLERVQQHRRR